MRIAIVANDTRGGVEPYATLTRGLASAGHQVVAVAPSDYRDLFGDAAASFVSLEGASRADIATVSTDVGMLRMGSLVKERSRRWARDARAGAAGVDLVCAGVGGMPTGQAVAESLGVPFVRAHLQPLDAPSSRYPGGLAPRLAAFGRTGNRLSHVVTNAMLSTMLAPVTRASRGELGLTGRAGPPYPSIIYGFSRRVVPVASDAQTRRVATGYWTTEEPGDPVDPQLRDFVERPGAVVSIGFGSMRTQDPAALRGLVEEAVADAGVRAVLLSGWGALTADASASDRVFVAESVPHGWLFSRVAATVHHGGAGTTGAALRGGVPTVVVPFGADQPFWASRAAALGVAPPPIPRRKLTAALLAEAIGSCLTSQQMQDRARNLGEDLDAEDGVGAAVREFERIAAER